MSNASCFINKLINVYGVSIMAYSTYYIYDIANKQKNTVSHKYTFEKSVIKNRV